MTGDKIIIVSSEATMVPFSEVRAIYCLAEGHSLQRP